MPTTVFVVTVVLVVSASVASSAPVTSGTPTRTLTHMRGDRYCELLLVKPVDGSIRADVYNSYPRNDCPESLWTALDLKGIATREGVALALRNGPRYWLMDRVTKVGVGDEVVRDFGGIEMTKAATVEVGPLAEAMKPYVGHQVARHTVFTFGAGDRIYQLDAPDGSRYVMQTWSQQIAPELRERDLVGLGTRLQLPEGWRFRSRVLRRALRIVTIREDAVVLQDDLMNSYSRVVDGAAARSGSAP